MKNKIVCISLNVHTYKELDDPPAPGLIAWVHRDKVLPRYHQVNSEESMERVFRAIKQLAVKP